MGTREVDLVIALSYSKKPVTNRLAGAYRVRLFEPTARIQFPFSRYPSEISRACLWSFHGVVALDSQPPSLSAVARGACPENRSKEDASWFRISWLREGSDRVHRHTCGASNVHMTLLDSYIRGYTPPVRVYAAICRVRVASNRGGM